MALRTLTTIGRKISEWNLLKITTVFATNTRNLKQGKFFFSFETHFSKSIILTIHLPLVTQSETADGTLVIAGTYVPSDRASNLVTVKLDHEGPCSACYMCKLNLDVKHTVKPPFLFSFTCKLHHLQAKM